MLLLKETKIEIKKSKFIGYLYELNKEEDIKNILNQLREENKKAKHIVYAYKFQNTAGKSDDKEPGGVALPLYQLLEKNNLNNYLIAIVRYYGGIKLGVGPLVRTYKNVAVKLLKGDTYEK